MAGKIWQRLKGQNPDNANEDQDNDPVANIPDPATAGDDGLTGPELAAQQAHDSDFQAEQDGDDPGTTYVTPDNDGGPGPQPVVPNPSTPDIAAAGKRNIDGLARQYVLKSYESLQRTPAPSLSANYRAQLLHFRDLVGQCHKAGIKSIGKLTATIIAVLAVDQRGKVDAKIFLTQLMRQAVWQASTDVERWRRADERANASRNFGEDDQRDPPMGMAGMSDHADAIQGIPSSSESVLISEDDALDALTEVNGFLSAFADAICDDENDRIYLGLEDGLPYLDKPGQIAGSWVPVHDEGEALDIQLIRNAESMARRDAERAQRRRVQLAQLGAALDG